MEEYKIDQTNMLFRQIWDSIPVIRKEIEDFLIRNPSQCGDIDRALVHLQKAQDILAKAADSGAVVQAFGEWKPARLIALRTILESEISAETGRLSAGGYVLRDERGWKIGERWIEGIWVTTILPSFDPPAMLAVAHEKDRVRGVFGVATSPYTVATSVISIDYPPKWSDPVVKVLRKANCFDPIWSLGLDGIMYETRIGTQPSQIEIKFSNPISRYLVSLQKALFQVAQEMVDRVGAQAEREYLAIWKRYIKEGESYALSHN